MKTVNERLKEVFDEKGLTSYRMAKQHHKTTAKYDQVLSGKNTPTSDTLLEFKMSMPDVNMEWVLTGNGAKYLDGNVRQINENDLEYEDIPLVSIQAYASFIECEASIPTFEMYRVLKTPISIKLKTPIVFEVAGNSMEPTILDRSKVLCSKIDANDYEYLNSGIYVVIYRDSVVIKRIMNNDLLLNGFLTLHSDNSMAGSLTIRKADILGIWKCIKVVEMYL